MQSYIYPAMHGACGFCYPDDASMNREDCHVLVETNSGVLRYRLASHRFHRDSMNKFHINVPAASQPRRVAIVIGGGEVDQRAVEPLAQELLMTVNGVPVPRKEPSANP
ncbi:MAG: TagA domain-containing protein, partial [Pirellula sp.]